MRQLRVWSSPRSVASSSSSVWSRPRSVSSSPSPLGRLPGDISIGGDGWAIYVPIATMIVLSLFLTLALNLVAAALRR